MTEGYYEKFYAGKATWVNSQQEMQRIADTFSYQQHQNAYNNMCGTWQAGLLDWRMTESKVPPSRPKTLREEMQADVDRWLTL